MLKNMFKFSWIFIAIISLMTACNKEESLDTEIAAVDYSTQAMYSMQESGNIGPFGCYEMIFPITVEFADETTQEVNSYEELKNSIMTWREANPNVQGKPSFAFPLEVITEDGELVNVNNTEELRQLKMDCNGGEFNGGPHGGKPHGGKPHGGKPNHCNSCFEIQFPISIQFPDETTQEVNSRMEIKQAMIAWHEANPDSEMRPHIVFPINVEMEDGETVEVGSPCELRQLKKECNDNVEQGGPNGPQGPDGWHPNFCNSCFSLQFPITIEFPDETTAEAESGFELRHIVRIWRQANPDSEEKPSFVFPINVEMEDGTIEAVNSEEDLIALADSCDD